MITEPASPVCYASEADDVYMGYAGRDELIAALNELLEAERAGARVASASVRAAPDQLYDTFMQAVRSDEARWCAMLSRQIRCLGGAASSRSGDFLGKAMAIDDPIKRLDFLNRGQAWVVRRLEVLLPRVRDEALHGDLDTMLDSHRVNIERARTLLRK